MAETAPDLLVELRVERDLAHLGLIKSTTEAFLSRSGLSDEEIYRVVIAVYEACSNVVEHAYGPEREGDLVLTLEQRGKQMKVQVRDWGKSFDLSGIENIDWDAYMDSGKNRGLGVHLMRQVMDKVDYFPDRGEGNLLVLERELGRPDPVGEG